MSNVSAKAKFVLGGVVIVAALGWLGFVGFEESKAYYITVDEYAALTEPKEGRVFKLAGDVVAGSIDRTKPQMEFIIASNNKEILVRYVGKDIIPIHSRTDRQHLWKEAPHRMEPFMLAISKQSAPRNTKRNTTREPLPNIRIQNSEFGYF